jgi:DNA-directed RNA polymerase specialized sigma24 family protein
VNDFASSVHVAPIETDYAVLRAWQRRASLATPVTVVARRLLFDHRNSAGGRGEPSAEASRGGAAAILFERLVRRDGQPLAVAGEPSLGRRDVKAMLAREPLRLLRLRSQSLGGFDAASLRPSDQADATLQTDELDRLSLEAGLVIRRAVDSFSVEDGHLLRLRFGSALSIAAIARVLRLPPRPLYRRLEALLGRLRQALVAAGIDIEYSERFIGAAVLSLDFELTGPVAGRA